MTNTYYLFGKKICSIFEYGTTRVTGNFEKAVDEVLSCKIDITAGDLFCIGNVNYQVTEVVKCCEGLEITFMRVLN